MKIPVYPRTRQCNGNCKPYECENCSMVYVGIENIQRSFYCNEKDFLDYPRPCDCNSVECEQHCKFNLCMKYILKNICYDNWNSLSDDNEFFSDKNKRFTFDSFNLKQENDKLLFLKTTQSISNKLSRKDLKFNYNFENEGYTKNDHSNNKKSYKKHIGNGYYFTYWTTDYKTYTEVYEEESYYYMQHLKEQTVIILTDLIETFASEYCNKYKNASDSCKKMLYLKKLASRKEERDRKFEIELEEYYKYLETQERIRMMSEERQQREQEERQRQQRERQQREQEERQQREFEKEQKRKEIEEEERQLRYYQQKKRYETEIRIAKEQERLRRISKEAEQRKKKAKEEQKRKEAEETKKKAIIANRERNRQRQIEKNQKEKEARKLLEQKKKQKEKEEDQALNEAVNQAVKEYQRSNNPVVSPKSKKSKKNKKKQTLIIEEVSQDDPESEFFMKNFAGPMWTIKYGNESSQNMNDSLHNTSEPLLNGTLHTEGNKITGAEIYPPVNSQHVLRLPEMPQPPERPPGQFVIINADRSDLIKTSSLASSYWGHCRNCDTCRRQILHESNVFLNIANNMENKEKAVQEAVQKLYNIKNEQMPEWVKKLQNKQIPEVEQTLMSTKNNECGIEIYFAATVHPETKERLCYTFIERMYQRLYGKYPVVKKVEIDENKTPILYRYRDNACAKLFQIKWEDTFKDTTQTESICCFNDWVMSVNDHQENIFIVSYIYSFIDSYVKNPTMEGEPYNLECFVMVC